jgi:hypothetical protein
MMIPQFLVSQTVLNFLLIPICHNFRYRKLHLAISNYLFTLDEAVAGIQTNSNFPFNNNGDYQITFTGDVTVGNPSTSVPEPTSTLGLLAFGTLGAGSMLKRKKATVKA